MSRSQMMIADWIRRSCYESQGRCLLAALVERVRSASRLPPGPIESEVRRMFLIGPSPNGPVVEGISLR